MSGENKRAVKRKAKGGLVSAYSLAMTGDIIRPTEFVLLALHWKVASWDFQIDLLALLLKKEERMSISSFLRSLLDVDVTTTRL